MTREKMVKLGRCAFPGPWRMKCDKKAGHKGRHMATRYAARAVCHWDYMNPATIRWTDKGLR